MLERIQYQDYLKCLKKIKKANLQYLKEKSESYELNNNKHEKEIIKIDKKHDKMFRNILCDKKEITLFLNQFLKIKKTLNEKDIIQCKTDYITRNYKSRQADIVYKLKNEPIYFLIEHQSSVDYEMPKRIFEYVWKITKTEIELQKIYKKQIIYPIIIPIVIYTGTKKWNAKTNFAEKQIKNDEFKNYKINLKYKLISIQSYTNEELLKNKNLISIIMLIEKCNTTLKLEEQMNKIITIITNEDDKEKLEEILVNIIEPIIGKNKVKQLLKKLYNRKEESDMSPLQKMLFEMKMKASNEGKLQGINEGKLQGINEGKLQGINEGRMQGINEGRMQGINEGKTEGINIAKRNMVIAMLEANESEEKIIKYAEIDKKELEKIKKSIKVS